MARLKFNSAGISNAKRLATNAKNTSYAVREGIGTIQRSMQSDVAARNNIAARLNNVRTNVSQVESDILSIYQMVDNASLKYNNTEKQVVTWGQAASQGKKISSKSANSVAFSGATQKNKDEVNKVSSKKTSSSGGKKSKEKFDWKLDDLASGLVSNAGASGSFVGGVISTTSDFYKGYKDGNKYDTYTGIVGIFDAFVSPFGDVAKDSCKAGVDWKEMLIGNWEKGSALKQIEKIKKNQGTDDVVEALFLDKMDEFNLDKTTDFGEKLSVGAKWAGTTLSFIGNGIDNLEDYDKGEMGAGRAVMETISETVVDFAIDTSVYAVVGAAAVAVGFTGPAVAVGAVAAGVVWGADALTRWATTEFIGEEKGLTELVSDTILDAGDAVLDLGKDVIVGSINTIKDIGNAVSNVGDAISTKWRVSFG